MEKVKLLEDLETKTTIIQKKIIEKTENILQKFIDNSVKDFIHFFKNQNCDVDDKYIIENRVVKANYRDSQITLIVPPIEIRYIVAYVIWDLYKDDKHFLIFINKLEPKSKVESLVDIYNNTKDLDEQIYIMQRKKSEAKLELQQVDKVIFVIGLTTPNGNKVNFPQYKNITELLKQLLD
ncbi:hypothetical protein [Clostridium botulinum]|nr:hypothetical protein [Clostridium botulinum]